MPVRFTDHSGDGELVRMEITKAKRDVAVIGHKPSSTP